MRDSRFNQDDKRKQKKLKLSNRNENKVQFDMQVLNHFYVGNMSIDRESNPSLNKYKIIQRQPNWIEYIEKGSADDKRDSLDRNNLEIFKNLKKFYQLEE